MTSDKDVFDRVGAESDALQANLVKAPNADTVAALQASRDGEVARVASVDALLQAELVKVLKEAERDRQYDSNPARIALAQLNPDTPKGSKDNEG